MGELYEKQADGTLKPLEMKPSTAALALAADYKYFLEVVEVEGEIHLETRHRAARELLDLMR